MVDLAFSGNVRLFQFHKVADMHVLGQFGLRSQTGVGPHFAARAHLGAVNVRKGFNPYVIGNHRITDYAVRSHMHAVAEPDVAFKDAAHINHHVFAAGEFPAHVKARGVNHRHAGIGKLLCPVVLPDPLKARKLRLGIHPLDFKTSSRAGRADAHAVTDRKADNISEIVLRLRVGGL